MQQHIAFFIITTTTINLTTHIFVAKARQIAEFRTVAKARQIAEFRAVPKARIDCKFYTSLHHQIRGMWSLALEFIEYQALFLSSLPHGIAW